MITILDLARKPPCDPTTIRKWIKKNGIQTFEAKASNGKLVQSLSDIDGELFQAYWKEITTLPVGMITIPDVALKNKVDRKTVRLWAKKNCVELHSLKASNGPATHAISKEAADKFGDEYNSTIGVPLIYFIEELGTDSKTIKRWLRNNECQTFTMKSSKGGRTSKAISKKSAADLEKYVLALKSNGYFYMIQLVPELDPNRIKLGFSKKPKKRIKQHQSVCPNAVIVKTWKCLQNQETPVRDQVTKEGCTRLYTTPGNKNCATEVYDCQDYKHVLQQLNQVFGEDHENQSNRT